MVQFNAHLNANNNSTWPVECRLASDLRRFGYRRRAAIGKLIVNLRRRPL